MRREEQLKYRRSYWSQVANPWVSASVMVGGLVSGVLLWNLIRLNNTLEASSGYNFTSVSSLSSLDQN